MKLNYEQQHALKVMDSGDNVFLTGGAGTGKTSVLREFIRKHEGRVMVCALTGIAAQLLGGTTIHRAFNMPSAACPKAGRKSCKTLEGVDTVIIDEISMTRMDQFEFVTGIIRNMEKKLKRKIQIIVSGDFFQLPPVLPDDERKILEEHYGGPVSRAFAFQSGMWDECNFRNIVLKKTMRQDDDGFFGLLSRIRIGDLTASDELLSQTHANLYDPGAVTVCAKNEDAARINSRSLAALQASERSFTILKKGDIRAKEIVCDERLILKEGCRVILIANLSARLVNGMTGTVRSIVHNPFSGRDDITVSWDKGGQSVITQYTWSVYKYETTGEGDAKKTTRIVCGSYTQIPLKLAYAVTVHRSQGQTYDAANLLISRTFACGLFYVAVSRVRAIGRLYIDRELNIDRLADPLVVRFYDELEEEVIPDPAVESDPKKTPSGAVRRGPKSKWNDVETTTIRIPRSIKDRVIAEARRIFEEECVVS